MYCEQHLTNLYLQMLICNVADDESEQGQGDEEKDAPQFVIFNEVHFTNTKMAR